MGIQLYYCVSCIVVAAFFIGNGNMRTTDLPKTHLIFVICGEVRGSQCSVIFLMLHSTDVIGTDCIGDGFVTLKWILGSFAFNDLNFVLIFTYLMT
jgi:hypothetical protein